jgi:hypothetical protein
MEADGVGNGGTSEIEAVILGSTISVVEDGTSTTLELTGVT